MVQNFHRITAIVSVRVDEERRKALKSRIELQSLFHEKTRLIHLIREREERLIRLQVCQSALAERADELAQIVDRLESNHH